MDLRSSKAGEARFSAYGGAHERDRACGPGQAASRLLLGFDDALRAQERGADGSDHSAKTDRGPASVAAAFYRRGKMVGREGSREGAGIGAAGAGTPRADRSVDHRRHELSQERAAFGRGGSTILRRALQAGQLSGHGDVVDRQSRCELAGGLSAVFAEGGGERSQTSAQGRSS